MFGGNPEQISFLLLSEYIPGANIRTAHTSIDLQSELIMLCSVILASVNSLSAHSKSIGCRKPVTRFPGQESETQRLGH